MFQMSSSPYPLHPSLHHGPSLSTSSTPLHSTPSTPAGHGTPPVGERTESTNGIVSGALETAATPEATPEDAEEVEEGSEDEDEDVEHWLERNGIQADKMPGMHSTRRKLYPFLGTADRVWEGGCMGS